MLLRTALIALSLTVSAACSPDRSAAQSPDAFPKAQPQPAVRDVMPPTSPRATPSTLPTLPTLPAPGQVLEAVYQDPGDRSSSYEVGNGSRATYWFGHTYELNGKRYYTGFVEQSPDHLGSDVQDDPPSAKATLTQATFTAPPGKGWVFIGAQRFVGEVGARGRADQVDDSRAPVSRPAAAGRLLLAVPTNAAIEQGTVQKNYEVLLRAPDGAWSHVGTVSAGLDDSAGCDQGRAFPCAPVTGRFSFDAGGDMPAVRVELAPADSKAAPRTVFYRFDPATSMYRTP